jgi:hypothetical protein
VAQALTQPMPLTTVGQLNRLPVLMSSGVLKLVNSMTTSGIR